jgi:hypothetical protein
MNWEKWAAGLVFTLVALIAYSAAVDCWIEQENDRALRNAVIATALLTFG